MSIDEILELMDDMLDKAVNVPFSNKKSLIDVDKMRELIDEIRLNMPREIKQAHDLVNDRKAILNNAKNEAAAIVQRAEQRANALVSQQEIVRQATAKANEINAAAQEQTKELRDMTNKYVDNMLTKVEELLSNDIIDVKKARSALKNTIR
ncbi:MAG: ATPase [Ruminiclostridium sp.]|nr:ATPase [Ruminiclostridium sp.]